MFRFIIACIATFLMVPAAFAQTHVMRVHDRIINQVTYERYVQKGNRTDAYDNQTGAFLFSVEESMGGRKTEMRSIFGGFIAISDRAPQDLRPGEETFGLMRQLLPTGQMIDLNTHIKASFKDSVTVVEMIGSATGVVLISRVGHRGNYRNPEWAESIMLINGQKVVSDYLTRVK